MAETAADTVARLARDGRGRLLAYLARGGADLAAAEDALADAHCQALTHWPVQGVPAKPEAWLLTVARRRLIDRGRRNRRQAQAVAALLPLTEQALEMAEHSLAFPDDRVRLMLVCAHPAVAPALRAPLMLQVVLGVDAARIAACLMVRPTTMGQRLSRAKAAIRDQSLGFDLPEPEHLPQRLPPVLDAVYAAFTLGRDDPGGTLAAEAVDLGRLLASWRPDDPEVLGLLALMAHCHARADAARQDGAYVPLHRQDPCRWDQPAMDAADRVLARAAGHAVIGRFQLEAAIQSVHNRRRVSGVTDWPTIVTLYTGLLEIAPSLGARLGHAAALAESEGPRTGWAALEALPAQRLANHQPYWALRAHLAERLGDGPEARRCWQRAMELCADAATRAFLARRLDAAPA